MSSRTTAYRSVPAVLALGVALLASACDDNPVDEGDGGHSEPFAVVVEEGGQEIASAEIEGSGVSEGEIHVAPSDETSHLDVHFVDEDGEEINFDADFYLEAEIEDTTIAEVEQDEPGEFGVHVHGLAEGETTILFRLMHGQVGSGHSDFDAEPIMVHVEP